MHLFRGGFALCPTDYFLAGSFSEHFQPVAVEFFGIAGGRLAMMDGSDSAKVLSHSSTDLILGLNTTYRSMSASFLSEISTYTPGACSCLHPAMPNAHTMARLIAAFFIGMLLYGPGHLAGSGFLRSTQRPA